MLEVGGHADGDAGGDDPLLEAEGLLGGDTGAAVHGAVAESVGTVVSQVALGF